MGRRVLQLELNLEPAAMHDPYELGRILREAADRVEDSPVQPGAKGPLFDVLGNRVGEWRVYKRKVHPADAASDLRNLLWMQENGGTRGTKKAVRKAARRLIASLGFEDS